MMTVSYRSYAFSGFLAEIWEGDDRKVVTTDGFGRVIQLSGARTSSTAPDEQRGYDSRGRLIWQATFKRGDGLPKHYDTPTFTTPGLLSMTSFEYDLADRIKAIHAWELEKNSTLDTTWTYDDTANSVTVTDRGKSTVRTYDGRGRLRLIQRPDTATVEITPFRDHDEVRTQTNQESQLVLLYYHDTRGNLQKVVNQGDNRILYSATYDDINDETLTEQSLGQAPIAYIYDSNRRLLKRTTIRAEGNLIERMGWDRNGRSTLYIDSKILEPIGGRRPEKSGWETSYTGFDQPLTITDPAGRVATYYYNKQAVNHPAGVLEANGGRKCFRYDGDFRLAYVYDVTDACVSPNAEINHPYTPMVERRGFRYDSNGQLSTASASDSFSRASAIQFYYDSLGRQIAQFVSGTDARFPNYSVSKAYSDAGRTVSTTVSQTCALWWQCGVTPLFDYSRRYDGFGRVAKVEFNGQSMAAYDYGVGIGGVLSIRHDVTGALTTYHYDNMLRQTGMDVAFANDSGKSDLIASIGQAYGADSVPRMRRRKLGIGAPNVDVFQVNPLGQIMAENPRVPASSVDWPAGEIENESLNRYFTGPSRKDYDLDSIGNLKSVTSGGNSVTEHETDELSRLKRVGQASYATDQRDNQYQIEQGLQFSFDAFSGLPLQLGVLTSSGGDAILPTGKSGSGPPPPPPPPIPRYTQLKAYMYDALGRRSMEIQGDGSVAVILWDGNQIVAQGDPKNLTFEIPGDDIDSHVAAVDARSGITRVYHQSQDQSVVAVSNRDGLLEGYSYSAFGEVRVQDRAGNLGYESRIGNRFLFQGQLYDSLSKTYSMRARLYYPSWGRFLSPDPIGIAGGPGLYSFAGGRPLSFRDPSGMAPQCDNGYCPNPDPPLESPSLPGASGGWSVDWDRILQRGAWSHEHRRIDVKVPKLDRRLPELMLDTPIGGPTFIEPKGATLVDPGDTPVYSESGLSPVQSPINGWLYPTEYGGETDRSIESTAGVEVLIPGGGVSARASARLGGAIGAVLGWLWRRGGVQIVEHPQLLENTIVAQTAKSGEGATSRILGFTERNLQKGFTKHGADFGLTGNWNPARASEFSATINKFINSDGVQVISGTYRGNPVTHYLSPSTGLNVIVDPTGNYVSGWRLGAEQLESVLSVGRLW